MKIVALIFMTAAASVAQTPGGGPSFDVASVKPSPRVPGQDRINISLGSAFHGTVTLANVTLSECIRYAYSLSSEDQISGPDWMRDRELRVDITAKAAPTTPVDQLLLMTQRLLAERFQMTLHREPRPVAHGELTVARKGLKESASQEPGGSVYRSSGVPGHMAYDHVQTRTLAVLLSRLLKQPVLDRTGLTGYYDIDLRWIPDGVDAAANPEPNAAPDIYAALERQLGLKMERKKSAIEVLVVDRAERVPIGN